MRQRAKHRLMGATVLVLIGVIGFPLLFDKQPRPIAVDTPIDIPDKNKVAPLVLPVSPTSSLAPVAPVAAPIAAPVAASAPQSVVITERAEPAKTVKPEAPVASPPAAVKPTEADKVRALLGGKSSEEPVAAATGRFVVQVGAFADPARAREVRLKLERAGLKTYTHVADTKDGPRTRVRVGPFTSKAEAEKTAEKVKKLNLPAALLTL
ncbi:MAG: SPOR domain-containing protein [Rhodoferax sp.]